MSENALKPKRDNCTVLGLTGGVASGKSTAARLFQELGVPVLDADQVARSLSAPGGQAYAAILARFGTADRAALRKKIFEDPQARRDLEAILHPWIAQESEKWFLAQAKKSTLLVYEAALLIETGRFQDFDALILVEAPEDLRIQRLIQRDGISETLARSMLKAQLTDSERRARAAASSIPVYSLKNDEEATGPLENLREQVRAIISKFEIR